MFVALCLIGLAIAFGIEQTQTVLSDRILNLPLIAVLMAGLWGAQKMEFQWLYLHAHGRSPYLLWNLAGSCLCGLLIWLGGRLGGVVGVCTGYLIMHVLIYLPLSTIGFNGLRQLWHPPAVAS